MEERGIAEGERVDVTSRFQGQARTVSGFSAVAHDVPAGCAVGYFPETNPLFPVDHVAPGSGTPAYKLLPVSVGPTGHRDEDAETVVS
jgi:anaerobic selenocysteine-containing dehydrogenase